jgi:hypothetical protein
MQALVKRFEEVGGPSVGYDAALEAGLVVAMLFLLSITMSPKELFVAQSYQSLVR